MSDPYFQKLFADRIGGNDYGKDTDIYKFEKIKRAKRQAMEDYPDRKLLDFGIGDNDEMAAESLRSRMAVEINEANNRGYADNGPAEFKEAVAQFMFRSYGVELDPTKEVNHCIGSKTALAMLPAVFINPGDVTLMTVPGYPVAGVHTAYYGGEVHKLPLLAENNFLPDLDSIASEVRTRAKLLVLNYPNSPTGKVATRDFYKKVIEFARENQLVVVQDAAHLPLTFAGEPLSFLSMPDAREVGVEVHTMSKGFNMIGWRIGWVCGHNLIVRAFADVKDNSDSGQFLAIQKTAAMALDTESIPLTIRDKYQQRLQKLVAMLGRCGFKCQMPGGSYFLYVAAPKSAADGSSFVNAEEVSQYLIAQSSIVTVPWDDAGSFLRFSATYEANEEAEEDALMVETEVRLKKLALQFN